MSRSVFTEFLFRLSGILFPIFGKTIIRYAGISLSRSKIQKILITGGCWSTERSREVQRLYEEYTAPITSGGKGLSSDEAIRSIAAFLGISSVSVSINLPYQKTVYDLDEKTPNAKNIERWRKNK